jgi:hypothetical protein
MDDVQSTPATGAAEAAAASPAVETSTPVDFDAAFDAAYAEHAADDASGGETPAEQPEPALVPSSRLREEREQRTALQEQLAQFEAFKDFLPVVQTLQELGFSPEQIAAEIEAYQQGPQEPEAVAPADDDPLGSFEDYLANQGIDPEWLDSVTEQLARDSYENARFRAELQAEREEQAQRTAQAELRADLMSVTEKFPLFRNPTLQRALVAQADLAASMATGAINGRQLLMQEAERLHAEIEAEKARDRAEYTTQKAKDGAAPVVTGGASPSPTTPLDIHAMSEDQADRAMDAYIRAARQAV